MAASEEDLLLLALFGEDGARLLRTLRGRGGRGGEGPEELVRSQSERVRELIELIEDSDVGELTLEDGAVRITVRKQDDRPPVVPLQAAAAPAAEPPPAEVSTTIKVESPMVGTFYSSPSPGAPPFVQEGEQVEVGQTLCLLEAMKLFNELKSDHAGVLRRALVENGEPVEYGQTLFELEPA